MIESVRPVHSVSGVGRTTSVCSRDRFIVLVELEGNRDTTTNSVSLVRGVNSKLTLKVSISASQLASPSRKERSRLVKDPCQSPTSDTGRGWWWEVVVGESWGSLSLYDA